ncbi:MAG: type II secretion system secretin GspD [Pseudomonadota bacterium]
MPPRILVFVAAFAVALLAGCAAPAAVQRGESSVGLEAEAEASVGAPAAAGPSAEAPQAAPVAAPAAAAPGAARVEPGTGVFIDETVAARGQARVPEGDVVFNFENQPVQAVIKAILGDLLQENYIIAPGVQGNVTFSTSKPINGSQARAVLETLLSWNNLALVYRDGRYTVLPVGQAIPGNLRPRLGPASAARGFEVRVVPLQYIAPTEMEKLLAPYVKQGAIVRADNARAMLVLAGTAAELATYIETVEIFDVDWLAGMSIGVFPLERVEAKTVVPELEKVFGEGGATPLAGMFRFMPIERMNAVLVITPQPKYLTEAERWLRRLDRGGSDAGAQLYVYYVKNVKAKDLATNLTEIFTGRSGGGSGGTRSAPIASLVPGVESVEIRSLGQGDEKSAQSANVTAAEPPPNAGSGIAIVESDDIRISAIEESNALLIRATPGQYDAIEAAIKRLDIEPLQVHIEAQIVQVDLTSNLSFGVRWFFENESSGAAATAFRRDARGYQFVGGTGTPTPRTVVNASRAWNSFAGTASSQGLAWTFLNTSAEALLTTLQDETTVSVLSAPSLVVLNNKEASINVGTQIPVVSSFLNPGTGVVNPTPGQPGTGFGLGTSFVQFRDTGLILNVTPRVNPGGLVYLEIKQEQSTPGTTVDPTGNVPVDKRVVETEIAVQSGETVLLAGLIRDNNNKSQAGVPGLMKVPLLGRLFSNNRREGSRQELLVLIKPTVISSSDEARGLTEEYKQRFRGIQPLIDQRADRPRER